MSIRSLARRISPFMLASAWRSWRAPGRRAEVVEATGSAAGSPSQSTINVYAATGANNLSPTAATALARIYVPNLKSNDVYVIDPATLKVVDKYGGGLQSAACGAVLGPEDPVGHR